MASIICGKCRKTHTSVAEVRACYATKTRTNTETGRAELNRVRREVPAGCYATELDGQIRFWKVDKPTEGRWKGYTFLMVQASDDFHPVRHPGTQLNVFRAITADPKAATIRYGKEKGVCGRCGKTLTSEWRKIGVGPRCYNKM